MVAFQFYLITFSCAWLCVGSYLISDLSDYKDYDANCVGEYLQNRYNLNISLKASTKKRLNYCTSYMETFNESFYETVANLIPTESRRECVVQLLKRNRVSDVFFKAIGYNYFKRQLVKFPSNKTCNGIVNVLRVDNDCEFREMTVNFIGNKSLGKLRACLDDLFSEFNVDEIVFANQGGLRVGRRFFGRHLSEYFKQLNETGKIFCSDLNLNLAVKYFAIDSTRKVREIYNETQIDCFKNFHINNRIIKHLVYRHSDTMKLHKDDPMCDEIMREQVESVITIDLFGFTEFSRRVKNCIIERNRFEQIIEQVVVSPIAVKYFDSSSSSYIKNTKKIIEMTLDCLQFF